ncbi:hypothetical protein SESBI_22247 [Sesbania bispinosa]|nr:hypothetical protein SESBI_22247 [Sesbania bispinosa]
MAWQQLRLGHSVPRTFQEEGDLEKEERMEQQKKLVALEMELAAAKHEGFVPKHLSGND